MVSDDRNSSQRDSRGRCCCGGKKRKTQNAQAAQDRKDTGRKSEQTEGTQPEKKLGGGGLLTCSHEIDMAQYLFGKVKEVSCIETKSNIKTNVDNSAFLILKHANGIISNITVDFSSQHQNQRKFEVILNDSSISWNFSEKKIKLLKDGKSRFIAAKKIQELIIFINIKI